MKLFGRPLELVILDVDGVIVEHHPHILNNMAAVARSMDWPEEPIRVFFERFLEGTERGKTPFFDFIRYIWGELADAPGKSEEFIRRLHAHEDAHPYPAMAGSLETVTWLRERGITVALSTNNRREMLLPRLRQAGYDENWFSAISTSDKGYHKPDPRMLTDVFERLGTPREHSVFIGDWYPDITCSRAADVPFLAVLSGGVPKRCFMEQGVPEDRILGRLSDLQNLIEL